MLGWIVRQLFGKQARLDRVEADVQVTRVRDQQAEQAQPEQEARMYAIPTDDVQAADKLCLECAQSIYGNKPPTIGYADQVGRMLLGTAVTESHLRHRRQMGFSLDNHRGAWGLWQTEAGSVWDGVQYLLRRSDVAARAARFVWGEHATAKVFANMASYAFNPELMLPTLLRIHNNDRLACLFARLHYLRVSSPVPGGLADQAAYWKRHYNTELGAGTVEKYIADWNRLVRN